MYIVLDRAFFIFHTALIVCIACGWASRRTRRLNLAVLLLTAFSWGILGLCYGLGYCPCTDWHWRVREHLGNTHLPPSYVKFLLDEVTGLDLPRGWVDASTVAVFAGAALVSVVLNLLDWRTR